MVMRCGGAKLFYATLGAPGCEFDRKRMEELSRQLKMQIVKYQGRAELRSHWLEVIETQTGTHFNLLFPANAEIVASIERSSVFAILTPNGKPILKIEHAPTPNQLLHDYLTKEATPQAKGALGNGIGLRRKGSHRLEGGGDRVRLSKALSEDCTRMG